MESDWLKEGIRKSKIEKKGMVIQFFLGLVFLASGVLKSMDVYGTELKFVEYGNNLGWNFLKDYNEILSILLCAYEICLGIWLLLFIGRKKTLLVLAGTLTMFTVMTLFFVIFPGMNVADCGCFGELIPMSMPVSLLKNIVLLALTFYVISTLYSFECVSWKDFIFGSTVLIVAFSILICLATDNMFQRNPTGYRKGTNLREKKEFVLLDQDLEDVKGKVLNSTGKTYIFVLKHQPDYANKREIQKIIDECKGSQDNCFALSEKDMNLSTDLPCYHVDGVLLKSLVRSHKNGVVLLDKGVVKKVWEMDRMWEWE